MLRYMRKFWRSVRKYWGHRRLLKIYSKFLDETGCWEFSNENADWKKTVKVRYEKNGR